MGESLTSVGQGGKSYSQARRAPSGYSHGPQACSHRVPPVEHKGGIHRKCLSQVRRRSHLARGVSAAQASCTTWISGHPSREGVMFLGSRLVFARLSRSSYRQSPKRRIPSRVRRLRNLCSRPPGTRTEHGQPAPRSQQCRCTSSHNSFGIFGLLVAEGRIELPTMGL
jgi:hypothetical protein